MKMLRAFSNYTVSVTIPAQMSRDMLERMVLLPLTGTCISRYSTAVLDQQCAKRSRSVGTGTLPRKQDHEDMCSQALLDESMKRSTPGTFTVVLPKSSISDGVHRLLKNFKSISQLFVRDETNDPELDIGQPTNVEHVTHIGWNGPATSNLVDGWEALLQTPKRYAYNSSLQPAPTCASFGHITQ